MDAIVGFSCRPSKAALCQRLEIRGLWCCFICCGANRKSHRFHVSRSLRPRWAKTTPVYPNGPGEFSPKGFSLGNVQCRLWSHSVFFFTFFYSHDGIGLQGLAPQSETFTSFPACFSPRGLCYTVRTSCEQSHKDARPN